MTTSTIVTGGSSGIGAEISSQAAADGHDVLVLSRTAGPVGRHVAVDLGQPAGWDALAAAIEEAIEPAEAVEMYHCAGTLTPIGFAGEIDAAAYRESVVLNAAGPPIVGDAFLRAVYSRRMPATLVMLTSGAARSAYPGWSAYCAGKAAMDHWVRTVGAEQAIRHGVKVVAIAPSVVDTPMQAEVRGTDSSDFPDVDRFRILATDGDLADPADVARRIRAVVAGLDSGAVVDLRDL